MGVSDKHIKRHYNGIINPVGNVAILGFRNLNWYIGDFYSFQDDISINKKFELNKKYDTIICLRSAYFCKNPSNLIKNCYDNLNDNGTIYIDFGIGDHLRYNNYKVGWLKGDEHEKDKTTGNTLHSALWDDSFKKAQCYKQFCAKVKKLGYKNVKKAIFDECPNVIRMSEIKKYFSTNYSMVFLWPQSPQLHILISGVKK